MRNPTTTRTLRQRVFLTLLPLVALVVALGGAGTVLLWHLGGLIGAILRDNYASVVAMERLNESLERIDSSFQVALAGQAEPAATQYEASWESYRESLRREERNITVPGEREAVEKLVALTGRYRRLGDRFYARAAGDVDRRRDYIDGDGLLDVFKSIKSLSVEIRDMNQDSMRAASRRARATAGVSVTGSALGLVAAIVLCTLLAWNTSRSLVTPIRALTKSAAAISEGNLEQTVSYEGPDELGELAHAFNGMIGRLRASRQAIEVRTEELRQAEEKYRSIFENALEGIFQSTPAGRFITVNHALAKMLGYASGRELMDSVHHIGEQIYVDPQRRIEFARRLVHDGAVQGFEAQCVRKDGSTVWLSYNARAVRDQGGAVLFYEGFVSDVSARKQAEQELSVSEANLNRAQEIARLGSWHLDVVENRLTWSDEVFRIFGLPKGTPLTYDVFLALVHPDDRERVDQAWAAAMRGAPYDIEHRIVVASPPRPDGTRESGALSKWVRERAELTFDANGAPREGIGTVQDITERRRGEERLRQLNRALRALSSCNHALVRASNELEWIGQLCRLIVEEAGYRLCWVGRSEHDEAKTVRPIAHAGFDEGYLEGAHISWADTERGRGPTGRCIRTGKVVLSNNIATDPLLAPWRAEALRRGYASSIAIPVVVDGQSFGALTIYAAEPDAFADAEEALLTELADDLAYGIAALRARAERNKALEELRALNADLEQRVARRTADLRAARDREANIGAKIQQQLLLDEPPHDLQGLEVAALNVPSQHIGGDFYGFFQHEGKDCLDLLVADVMGKGVPAALLSAATKSHFPEALWHLMATSATGELPAPQEIVTLAHTHMARQLVDIESFVTLCYTRIDVTGRTLSLVDCGHTGLLHLHRRTGRLDVLHGDNLPLGVREGEIFRQITVPIEPEDIVVFYSDGVTEARNLEGELFGVERLVACVRQNAGCDSAAMVSAVREAVGAFSGPMLADDLTCVVAKLLPYEAPIARSDLGIGSKLAELHRAREFVKAFCEALPNHPLADDGIASLALAVNEAASNVMKHAYDGREDQRIDVRAEAFQDHVTVRVRYQGAPFDPSLTPPPSFDGSRDSGFGVFMIAESVDAVRYYKDDLGRSCIRLEKRREAA